MEIKVATDWQQVGKFINAELRSIGYNHDLHKMYSNITSMVSDLSRLEVDARRTKSYVAVNQKLMEINKAIKHLESLLLMAKLMR